MVMKQLRGRIASEIEKQGLVRSSKIQDRIEVFKQSALLTIMKSLEKNFRILLRKRNKHVLVIKDEKTKKVTAKDLMYACDFTQTDLEYGMDSDEVISNRWESYLKEGCLKIAEAILENLKRIAQPGETLLVFDDPEDPPIHARIIGHEDFVPRDQRDQVKILVTFLFALPESHPRGLKR